MAVTARDLLLLLLLHQVLLSGTFVPPSDLDLPKWAAWLAANGYRSKAGWDTLMAGIKARHGMSSSGAVRRRSRTRVAQLLQAKRQSCAAGQAALYQCGSSGAAVMCLRSTCSLWQGPGGATLAHSHTSAAAATACTSVGGQACSSLSAVLLHTHACAELVRTIRLCAVPLFRPLLPALSRLTWRRWCLRCTLWGATTGRCLSSLRTLSRCVRQEGAEGQRQCQEAYCSCSRKPLVARRRLTNVLHCSHVAVCKGAVHARAYR